MRWRSCLVALLGLTLSGPSLAADPEVIVLSGFEQTRDWLAQEGWWGEVNRETQLSAPNVLITGISLRWAEESARLPVSQKKEIFYRFLLPLILHANELVLDRRATAEQAAAAYASTGSISEEALANIREFAPVLRIMSRDEAAGLQKDDPALAAVFDELLYKLDVIPAGLALGQAAYESGYGTSRFAAEGNALFGQWTFGGEGLKPEQQREELGDHRIAAENVKDCPPVITEGPIIRKLASTDQGAGLPVFDRPAVPAACVCSKLAVLHGQIAVSVKYRTAAVIPVK